MPCWFYNNSNQGLRTDAEAQWAESLPDTCEALHCINLSVVVPTTPNAQQVEAEEVEVQDSLGYKRILRKLNVVAHAHKPGSQKARAHSSLGSKTQGWDVTELCRVCLAHTGPWVQSLALLSVI